MKCAVHVITHCNYNSVPPVVVLAHIFIILSKIHWCFLYWQLVKKSRRTRETNKTVKEKGKRETLP